MKRLLNLPALFAFLWPLGMVLSMPAAAQTFDAAGKYELVQPPQRTSNPGKVEVLDVFWFGCPHCFHFLPNLEAYRATNPEGVEFKRMPAIFRPIWELHARAYYTGELLGVADDLHHAVFSAMHKDNLTLDTREAVMDFYVKNGVDNSAFEKTYDSFAVESLVRKSRVMQGRYGISGTPTVIVNGKYRVSGRLAGSYENMIKVIEALVAKEKGQQ